MSSKIEPREHQIEAHEALVEGLATSSRVRATMCCGSGKTYTQAFLAREVIEGSLEDDPVIVCFVPNKDLIHQNAKNFRNVFGDDVDYLGVCTPSERAENGQEDPHALDLTTDPDEAFGAWAPQDGIHHISKRTYSEDGTYRS